MPHRERLPYTDPLRSGRHPFQTFILALCIVSGAPMALGQITAGSINEKLPEPLVIAWGIMLVLGSGTALFGTYWRNYATSLTLERVGLWSTGVAALVYGVCILSTRNAGGLVATGIILAFGAACISRALDIGHIFHRALSEHPRGIDTEDGR